LTSAAPSRSNTSTAAAITERVGIDHGGRVELHQVRLQQYAFAANVQAAFANTFEHPADQVVGIRSGADDSDSGVSRWSVRELGRLLQLGPGVCSHYCRAAEY
jgi:hypothetical protein